MNEELPDVEPPWFSMPTEGEYSEDLEDGTPYDIGYKVDEQYNKCLAAMDFHHINPEDKVYDVKVLMTRRWELIKEEIDKCILLCSNCHRELHWNERQRKKLDNTL